LQKNESSEAKSLAHIPARAWGMVEGSVANKTMNQCKFYTHNTGCAEISSERGSLTLTESVCCAKSGSFNQKPDHHLSGLWHYQAVEVERTITMKLEDFQNTVQRRHWRAFAFTQYNPHHVCTRFSLERPALVSAGLLPNVSLKSFKFTPSAVPGT
jgi:hypothetical protein